MPTRLVHRRRDGLVQISPARFLDRLRPLVSNVLLGPRVVRTLWRWLRGGTRARLRLGAERPRLALVGPERSGRSPGERSAR